MTLYANPSGPVIKRTTHKDKADSVSRIIKFGFGLSRERCTAAAAARRVWIRKGKARPHDTSHIVDLHAIQILRAEHIYEEANSILVENMVAIARLFFYVQAVLKS